MALHVVHAERLPVRSFMISPATGVSFDSIREAADGLAGVAVRTPLVDAQGLSGRLGVPVALKLETRQPIGAFKIRGAYTALARLDPSARAGGVVTSSSGNHGQGVAWAARHFGVRAVVVMPQSTPRIKVEGVRRWGGEVVFAGPVRSPAQTRRAEELAATDGLVFIPPFDHPDVIAGQGTCGLEILEDRADVACIVVPVGGGGLLAGICAAAASRPEVGVVAVEPASVPKLSAALAAGHPVEVARTESLADGLLTPAIGDLTFPIIRDRLSRVVQVSEDDLTAALRVLHEEAGLVVEPSGAAAVAALLAGRVPAAGPIVAVVTGGNVDPALFDRLVR